MYVQNAYRHHASLPPATCFKHVIPTKGEGFQSLLNYCLLVYSLSSLFHMVIIYLFSFVAVCLVNFPPIELFTYLVTCLLLNVLSLYLWVIFSTYFVMNLMLSFEVLGLV
jgi:hypothetical protein